MHLSLTLLGHASNVSLHTSKSFHRIADDERTVKYASEDNPCLILDVNCRTSTFSLAVGCSVRELESASQAHRATSPNLTKSLLGLNIKTVLWYPKKSISVMQVMEDEKGHSSLTVFQISAVLSLEFSISKRKKGA